jgi:hypothetical protein
MLEGELQPQTAADERVCCRNPQIYPSDDALDLHGVCRAACNGVYARVNKKNVPGCEECPTAAITSDSVLVATVRGVNRAGLSADVCSPLIKIDETGPDAGNVNDGDYSQYVNSCTGLCKELDCQASDSRIDAHWAGFADGESGIVKYEWAVGSGLGRTVALCYRSSTSYPICTHIRRICFLKRQCDRTLGRDRPASEAAGDGLPGRGHGHEHEPGSNI